MAMSDRNQVGIVSNHFGVQCVSIVVVCFVDFAGAGPETCG